MANGIGQAHNLGNQKRKQPDMTTHLLQIAVSISKCHNTKDKKIHMALNSSSANTTSSTTTADVHKKPADTIEK